MAKKIDKRDRRTIAVQLLMDDEREYQVIRYTNKLKTEKAPGVRGRGRLRHVVRDSLLLYQSLEDGNLDLLKTLFPELYEKLYYQMEADVMERGSIKSVLQLEQLVKQVQKELRQPRMVTGMIAPLAPLPDDDEDLDIEVGKDTRKVDTYTNFMKSLGALDSSYTPEEEKPGGIKALDVPQFAPPDFDDD